MKAFLVYNRYFSADGRSRSVGGIQTYIRFLAKLFASEGISPVVVQMGSQHFEREDEGVAVVGCAVEGGSGEKTIARALWEEVKARADYSRDYVVFCTDSVSVPTDYRRALLIQHGVSWDIPLDLLPTRSALRQLSEHMPFLGYLRKGYQAHRYRRYFYNTRTRVCVDYNFPNWLRTLDIHPQGEGTWIIPNCVFPSRGDLRCSSPTAEENANGLVRVLYARRFERYRGSRLMADAIDLLCNADSNICFTFAGEGADLEYLKSRFVSNANVRFARYEPDESLAFHMGFDIAVVPSLASEGTTLSALEAMAAGCALVATPVGGLSNIVLDGFNGIFTKPTPLCLSQTILALTRNPVRRAEIAERGKMVIAEGGFAYDTWRLRWLEVIENLR